MTNAVIYCRVSTDEEIQLNALVKQIAEAKECVKKNGWILVDEYVDEGKSGTMTKHRNEYNRLYSDMETDKFDVIVIKSQDRLMRSTKDWYLFLDKLVQNKKKLYFYLESKFYSTDDALITGIKAILAEEYSRDLSKKINNAHRGRQKNKGNLVITSKTWGYDNINKKIVVNEKEAEVVRKIFRLCIEGKGSKKIARILTEDGVYARDGKPFNDVTVRCILRNPLFKGNAVMNRYHYDFNSKITFKNDEEEWIIKENGVPAIVDADTWLEANLEIDKRVRVVKDASDTVVKLQKNPGTHPLSSKIICAECGSHYYQRTIKRKRTPLEQVVRWNCSEYSRFGRKTIERKVSDAFEVITKERGCDNIVFNLEDLNRELLSIAEGIFSDKDSYFEEATKILSEVLSSNSASELEHIDKEIEDLVQKRSLLLDRFLDGVIEDGLYRSRDKEYGEEEKRLKTERKNTLLQMKEYEDTEKRLHKIQEELEQITSKDLPLQFIYKQIKQIKVHRDRLEIEFDGFTIKELKVVKNEQNYPVEFVHIN